MSRAMTLNLWNPPFTVNPGGVRYDFRKKIIKCSAYEQVYMFMKDRRIFVSFSLIVDISSPFPVKNYQLPKRPIDSYFNRVIILANGGSDLSVTQMVTLLPSSEDSLFPICIGLKRYNFNFKFAF